MADTGPLVAAVDSGERPHRVAVAIIERIGRDLLIPDFVIAEVDHILRRVSAKAARAFLKDVRDGNLTRVALDQRTFARALEYDVRFAELGLGIADASVMALAERERAPILTFDFRDFRATNPLRGGHWTLVMSEDEFRAAGR